VQHAAFRHWARRLEPGFGAGWEAIRGHRFAAGRFGARAERFGSRHLPAELLRGGAAAHSDGQVIHPASEPSDPVVNSGASARREIEGRTAFLLALPPAIVISTTLGGN